MLKIIGVDHSLTDPISVNEVSIVNKIADSKVFRGKVGTKTAKSKSKSKNLVKPLLAKSQSFAQNFRSDFFLLQS